MTISAGQTYLSPEEYITLERKAIPTYDTVRSEYVKGKIVAMSGASRAHNLISGNFLGELRNRLKDSGCEVYANEMCVSTPALHPISIQMSLSFVMNPVLKTMFLTYS